MTRLVALSRTRLLPLAVIVLAAVVILVARDTQFGQCARAADIEGADYCYQLDITITNNTGAALTNYGVRVTPIGASTFIATDALDERGWDIFPIIGSETNEVDLFVQTLTSNSAAWWVLVPTILDGQTLTTRMYIGNDEQKRNQGLAFTGSDEAVASSTTTALNITDNLRLDVDVDTLVSTAQTSTLVSYWASDQGYRLRYVSSAGALAIQAQVDAQTCTVAWDSAWTATSTAISMRFANPNLDVYVNDVSQLSCNTGLGAITAPNTQYLFGTSLSDTIIRDVRLLDANTVVTRYGFDARYVVETSAANPYTGTIEDYGPNNMDLEYTLNRSQTNITVSVGALVPYGAEPGLVIPTVVPSVLGDSLPVSSLALPTPGPTPDDIFHTLIGANLTTGNPAPAGMIYSIFFGSGAVALAVFVAWRSKHIPIAIFTAGIPLAIGVLHPAHYIHWFWLLIWAIFTIVIWLADRMRKES